MASVSIAAVIALAGSAFAASVGGLTYLGCTADRGRHECAAPPQRSLGGANGIVVSPDGENAYVTSYFANTITTFARRANGSLIATGCVARYGNHDCSPLRNSSLYGAEALAISPDGQSVYAGSEDGTLTGFHRSANGSLRFQSCVGSERIGCVEPPNGRIGEPQAVTVSADGSSVYSVSFYDDSVTAFHRRPDGTLDFVNCIAPDFSTADCETAPHDSLLGANDVVASPDGRSVYVGSGEAITTLRRRADGSLAYGGCIATRGDYGCARARHPLGFAWSVAMSPDGRSLYATSLGNTVTSFARDATGRLTYQGCIADYDNRACAEAAEGSLLGTDGIAVSPTGHWVYVGGLTTVTRLRRSPGGRLAYQDCVADRGRDRPPDCRSIGSDALYSVRGIAPSPNGARVYATSFRANAVVSIAAAPGG